MKIASEPTESDDKYLDFLKVIGEDCIGGVDSTSVKENWYDEKVHS